MRTDSSHINTYRNRVHPQFKSEDDARMNGFFVIPLDEKNYALVIASEGEPDIMPWEHVSARIGEKHNRKLKERLPTWDEMCLIKEIFWTDQETVVQFHPAKADYVNFHPCVLHLWRPLSGNPELPPRIAV